MSRVKDISVAQRLIRTQQSAESRGIDFDLSFATLKRVLNTKRCFFTGNKLTFTDPQDPNYLTLDRLDASVGYIDNNVVACGREFNQRKGDLTAKDIILLYKALVKKQLI